MSAQAVLILSIAGCVGLATGEAPQKPDDKLPSFEVATLKPSEAGSVGSSFKGGPGTAQPGQITIRNLSLDALLERSYGLKEFQIKYPGWFEAQRYDITAKVPAGATKADSLLMLRRLLTERLRIQAHFEKKVGAAYRMTVVKGGIRFAESKGPHQPPVPGTPEAVKAKMSLNGVRGADGLIHLSAESQPIARLVQTLSMRLRCPVSDETGLAGVFDYELTFAPDSPTAAEGTASDDSGPTLFAALRRQLGLNLESVKQPVEILVVDSASRIPLEN